MKDKRNTREEKSQSTHEANKYTKYINIKRLDYEKIRR